MVLGILAAARAWLGWLRKSEWVERDRKIGVFFSSAMDTQLLLGLLLYFLFSPITRSALSNFGAAMGDSGARFFALEHTLTMFLAVVFAHLGSILPRKASQATAKHRQVAIWFSLAVLLILQGMPWMRPLLPGL